MAESVKPSRRLRWLARAIGGIATSVVLVLVYLLILFQSHPIPEALKQPPAALARLLQPPAPRPASGGHAGTVPLFVRPTPVPWSRPEPPKGFEDYIRFQLEANPNDSGAEIYLRLVARFQDEKFVDSWGKVFGGSGERSWRPGAPLTDEQKKWLLDHQDFIDLLRRMIAAGGPPMTTREDILAASPVEAFAYPVPNYLFFQTCAKILAAESRRLHDAGDLAGAAGALADIYPFSRLTSGTFLIGDLISIAMEGIGNRSLGSWLAGDPPPAALRGRLQDVLDAIVRPATEQISSVEMEGLMGRRILTYMADRPLLEVISLMSDIGNINRHVGAGYREYLGALIEHPAEMLSSTFKAAMIKANGATYVQEYDAFMTRYLESFHGPFTTLNQFDADAEVQAMSPYNPARMGIPNYPEVVTRAYVAETGMNLGRAGLRMLQGESPATTADPENPDWSASPWRDPFTEQPLQVAPGQDESGAETDESLLYSLGPDLEDQHGQVTYDTTNGSRSAGDIILRLPRR